MFVRSETCRVATVFAVCEPAPRPAGIRSGSRSRVHLKDSARILQCPRTRPASFGLELLVFPRSWIRLHDACVTSARSSWEFGFPALPAAPGGLRPGRGFDVWHVPAASGPPWTPASQRGPQCVGHTHPARLSQGLLVPGTAEPLRPFGSFGWNVCTPRLGRKGDPRACRVCVRPPFVRCRELSKR